MPVLGNTLNYSKAIVPGPQYKLNLVLDFHHIEPYNMSNEKVKRTIKLYYEFLLVIYLSKVCISNKISLGQFNQSLAV